MIAPKLVATSLKHAWARAILVAIMLVVAGCQLPGAEHPALPATPTPAASPVATRPSPVTVTAVASKDVGAAAAPTSTPSAVEVATARAQATARSQATVATWQARATLTPRVRVIVIDKSGRRSICTGYAPLVDTYKSPDSVKWTSDGAHILLTFNAEVWAVTPDGSRAWRLAQAWREPATVRSPSPAGWMTSFDVTPDGQHVVYSTCAYPPERLRGATSEQLDKYAFDYELAAVGLDGQAPRRLTRHEAFDNYPAWSPDGTRIAFVSDRGPGFGLYTMAVDGTGVRPLGLDLAVSVHPLAWSPDGRSLAVNGWRQDGGPGLYVVQADGTGSVRLPAAVAVSGGAWSPDGTRLAFAQPEGAGLALYTIGANGKYPQRVTVTPRWQPRYGTAGGWIHTLAWSPDGSKLLYACGPEHFCVVTLDGQPVSGPCPGRVDGTVCYSRDGVTLETSLVGAWAAWSPDGARIAVASRPEPRVYYRIVLYSVAPDGSDQQSLALEGLGAASSRSGQRTRTW